MKSLRTNTEIRSTDIDDFVSSVAASIWNRLIEGPAFEKLQLSDYSSIYEAVLESLRPYAVSHQSQINKEDK
jgi:hypothetical protein